MTESAKPAQLFARARGQINAAWRALEADEIIDLADLVKSVQDLCQRIESQPTEVGVPMQPKLIALMDELERLAEAFAKHRDEAKRRLEEMAGNERAASAYARGPGKS